MPPSARKDPPLEGSTDTIQGWLLCTWKHDRSNTECSDDSRSEPCPAPHYRLCYNSGRYVDAVCPPDENGVADDHYPTIGAAINAAADGEDTVKFAEGVFYECGKRGSYDKSYAGKNLDSC
eukprot:gene8427-21660_t